MDTGNGCSLEPGGRTVFCNKFRYISKLRITLLDNVIFI